MNDIIVWLTTVFLTDDWLIWVWKNYSMAIVGVPSVVMFVLKVLAIYNPRVKSSEIADLFSEYWPKKPGTGG
jgi:hypothetical protein